MRKTKVVKIEADGRDRGKQFLITELPAMQAEAWATRAFLALANSGVDIGEVSENAGMAGLAYLGLRALTRVRYEDAKPLLDEMMTCVKIIPDPSNPAFVRDLVGQDDIEEVATVMLLRAEVFELHTDFSIRDAILRSVAERNLSPTYGSSETSQPSSGSSSRPN